MEHVYEITVPSFLCTTDDTLGLDGLAGIFQEAAWQHARSFGVDFTGDDSAVFWALHRLGVVVNRPPRWNETVRVVTWPSRMEKLFAMREYRVEIGGETVALASSSWLILQPDRRPGYPGRPVPPQRHLSEEWTSPDVPLDMPLGRLDGLDEAVVAATLGDNTRGWHTVRPSDTDRNNHVNNARYVQWFRDAAAELVQQQGKMVTLTFLAETRAGDQYQVVKGSRCAEIHVRRAPAGADTAGADTAGAEAPSARVAGAGDCNSGTHAAREAVTQCACRLNVLDSADISPGTVFPGA